MSRSNHLLTALAVVAFAAFGCSSAPEDPAPDGTGTVEQALGGTCPTVCSSSASCSQSCTIDTAQGLQTITCGQYGVCKPPPPAPTPTVPPPRPPDPWCGPGKRCILFAHDAQGNVICRLCANLSGQ